MTIIDLEKDLTNLFAEQLELIVDQTIFRGILPASKVDAIGVHVEDFDTDNAPSIPALTLQLLGRYSDRDQALSFARKIDAALPYYSESLTILKVGSIATYPSTHKGKDVTGISANLSVRAKNLD